MTAENARKLTDAELQELVYLDGKRTPGEWWAEEHVLCAPVYKLLGTVEHDQNMPFVVAASRALGPLVAEVLALRAKVARLETKGDTLAIAALTAHDPGFCAACRMNNCFTANVVKASHEAWQAAKGEA